MLFNQTAGLDLLLRVVAAKVATRSVFVTYHLSSILSANHGLSTDVEMIAEMTGALEKSTNKATGG